jgi:hypothetical protein
MERPAIALTQYPIHYEQPVIRVPDYGSTQTPKLARPDNPPTATSLTFCSALTGNGLTQEQVETQQRIAVGCSVGAWGAASACCALPACFAMPGGMVTTLQVGGGVSMIVSCLSFTGLMCVATNQNIKK